MALLELVSTRQNHFPLATPAGLTRRSMDRRVKPAIMAYAMAAKMLGNIVRRGFQNMEREEVVSMIQMAVVRSHSEYPGCKKD